MEVIPHEAIDDVEAVAGVHLAQLVAGDRMSVQHFSIEPECAVPEHSHEHEQVGYLVEGAVTFVVDGERRSVEAGDSYAVPANEPHAVENRSDEPAKGIDVFSPPRVNPNWG